MVLNHLSPAHAPGSSGGACPAVEVHARVTSTADDDNGWNMEKEVDWREAAEGTKLRDEYESAVADEAELHCPFHKAHRAAVVPPAAAYAVL